MPFDGAGVFTPLNPPTFPAVSGTVIRSNYFNDIVNDLIAGLSNCITKDGQTVVTSPIAFSALSASSFSCPTITVSGAPVLTKRYSTGEIIAAVVAPADTLELAGGTIGSALSGATVRANADTQALFVALWNNTLNVNYTIQDSSGSPTTRGASAAADFAAHKRFPLPIVGDGETLVASGSLPVLNHSNGAVISHGHTATVTDPGHRHEIEQGGGFSSPSPGDYFQGNISGGAGLRNSRTTTTGVTVAISDTGGAKNQAAGLVVKFYIAL